MKLNCKLNLKISRIQYTDGLPLNTDLRNIPSLLVPFFATGLISGGAKPKSLKNKMCCDYNINGAMYIVAL